MPELEDERYVRELFEKLYGVQLRKVPESAAKTFDFELISEEQRVAAVEVKCLGLVPRTPENGWVVTDYGFKTRPAGDNGPARVGAAIHKAYQQLATSTDPKVLVVLNDESLIDHMDLHEAVQGYLVYGTDEVGRYKNPSGMKIAEGRIKDEKLAIDLYIWINRHKLRVFPPLSDQERGPFFRCTSDAGHELAKRYFKMPHTPRPERDPDADVPTLQEMLLREAGIIKKTIRWGVWAEPPAKEGLKGRFQVTPDGKGSQTMVTYETEDEAKAWATQCSADRNGWRYEARKVDGDPS